MKKNYHLPLCLAFAAILGLFAASGGCRGGGTTRRPPYQPPPDEPERMVEIGRHPGLIGRLEKRVKVRATVYPANKDTATAADVWLTPGTWLVPGSVFIPPAATAVEDGHAQ